MPISTRPSNMSASNVTALAERARETGLQAVWAQWSVLNARLLGRPRPGASHSVIDPEALVLASLALWDEERRLADVLAWWAEHGAPLLSVRRMDSLRRSFPAGIAARVEVFSAWAREAGDTRWKPKPAAADVEVKRPARSGKGPSALTLSGSQTLLLKLRAGFGVSAKPDVLCYLLALDGEGASSKEIARAVAYADKNVRLAARDLALGGFIEEREGFPAQYAARPDFSGALVNLLSGRPGEETGPGWTHWWGIYAFLLHVASWAEEPGLAQPYPLSSRARELFTEYRWAFPQRELPLPDPRHYPGERYLGAFETTLNTVANWLDGRAG
jgi:hypothetical protein